MRRILLLLAVAAILAVPAAATARAHRHDTGGFLVIQNGFADGGITGSPVATIVLKGFIVGRIATEGSVQLYPVTSSPGSPQGQATGVGVARRRVLWHGISGTEFSGSRFRFRAVGGVWRVVVYGAGVSLYAGGVQHATLHGSVAYPHGDGEYSLDGKPFVSLPSSPRGGHQAK